MQLRRERFDENKWAHLAESVGRKGRTIIDKIQRAVSELRS